MQRGFIGTIILLLLLAAVGGAIYYIYTNYAKTPNQKTIEAANSINKYPDATSWEIKEMKNFCLQPGGCDQPVQIMFETPKEWGSIYHFYISDMTNYGWETNSSVLTSIPTSVIFTKRDGCKASLENHNELKYSLTISCPQT